MFSVDYGTGNYRRFININNCYQHIGESNALALQFFHALSGCDSTSFIYKKSKTVLFNRWMHSPKYEDLTEAFQKLSWLPSQQTIEECLPILYQFLESAFGGGYGGNLDEFRLTTFKASSSNNLRELPPSRRGLELHVRRASFLHIRLVGSGAMLYPKSQHQNFLNLVEQLLMVSPIFFGQQMVQKRVLLMKSQKPASAKFHHQA